MNFLNVFFWLSLASLLQWSSVHGAPSEVMLDFAIVIQKSILGSVENLDGLKATVHNFGDQFKLGANFSRVAISACRNSTYDIILDFTDDPTTFTEAVNDLNATEDGSNFDFDSQLAPCLRAVHELEWSTRNKVVIVFSQGNVSDLEDARKEMAMLQKNDTLVYLVTDTSEVKEAITEIPEERKILVESYSQMTSTIMQSIRADVESSICDSTRTCLYEGENQKCVGDWLIHNGIDCKKIKSKSEPCTRIDCDQTCDRLWPWSEPIECKRRCGPLLNVTRLGQPPQTFLEQCPTEFICECNEPPFLEEEEASNYEIIAAILIGVGLQFVTISMVIGVMVAAKWRSARRVLIKKAQAAKRTLINLKNAPTPNSLGQKKDSTPFDEPSAPSTRQNQSQRMTKSGSMAVSFVSRKSPEMTMVKSGAKAKSVRKKGVSKAVGQKVKSKAVGGQKANIKASVLVLKKK